MIPLLCLAILSESANVYGAEAVALKKGDPAPFAGQLLTPELAVSLSVGAEKCLEKYAIDIAHEKRICKLASTHAASLTRIHSAEEEAKVKILENALKSVQAQKEIPFWEEPGFVGPVAFGIGVAVSLGVAYASVWAWQQVANSL